MLWCPGEQRGLEFVQTVPILIFIPLWYLYHDRIFFLCLGQFISIESVKLRFFFSQNASWDLRLFLWYTCFPTVLFFLFTLFVRPDDIEIHDLLFTGRICRKSKLEAHNENFGYFVTKQTSCAHFIFPVIQHFLFWPCKIIRSSLSVLFVCTKSGL